MLTLLLVGVWALGHRLSHLTQMYTRHALFLQAAAPVSSGVPHLPYSKWGGASAQPSE